MATMLFIGTNVWANVHDDYVAPDPDQEILGDEAAVTIGNVTKYADKFKEAWDYVQAGQTAKITLKRNVSFSDIMWLGTAEMNGTTRTIEIDLAGNKMETTGSYAFLLTHGVLKFSNSVPGEGKGILDHKGSNEAILVTGSTYKDVDPSVDGANYFSHLVIGANVTVKRTGAYKPAVVAIDGIAEKTTQDVVRSRVNYSTNVYAPADGGPNKCVANGVRIDVYGTLNGQRYGIKPNGYIGNVSYFINSRNGGQALPAEGTSPKYSNARLDANYKIQDGDDSYSAFIHIYAGATVTALSEQPQGGDGTPAAVYGGGYARWQIDAATIQGASGAIFKSGNIVINDATIEGQGTYKPSTHTTASNTGQGSGLLIVSDNSWAGDVNVTVNGSTSISSDKGYAVEEVVPAISGEGSKVDAIQVNGGTFEGGEKGAISISEKTKEETIPVVVVSATITGEVSYGNEGDLTDIIPTGKEDVTIAYNDQTQQYTVVVTVVDTPAQIGDDFDIDDAEENANIDLSGDDLLNKEQSFDSNTKSVLTLGTLTINNLNEDVTLTITEGHTIIANKVILGDKAQLIVEPGATLIVKGTEGIVSTKPENIVLQANDQTQATFLLNPAVLNNAEPNATVEMYTVCKQTSANPYYYIFQEFALPVKETGKPDNSYEAQTLYPGQTQFSSSVRAYDYANHKFDYLTGGWGAIKPFINYQLTNNTKDGGITYYFEGKLLGNKNRYCQFVDAEGFGYFGNSHLAPINVEKLMEDFSANVEKTVWVYDYANHKYNWVNEDSYLFGPAFEEIKSMQAFVLYLNEGEATTAPINYANAVWGNPRFASMTAQAPARNQANTLNNGALIKVVAANGMADNVIVMEKDAYTSNFDNGSDASKLMNENGINLYATTAMGNLSCVADNSIENTLLSFKAGEASEYMLQLGKVFGEDYAIRDNVTGAIINCTEGTEYAFTQEANTLVSGRFELISIAKMPTAIENTEMKASAKGIYTLMGQYLGENFEILPAGVYVVNGIKVVK